MSSRSLFSFPLTLLLTLFLFQCGGTETTNPPPDVTDPPPVEEGRQERNYSPDHNQLDPQRAEFFSFYNRQRDFPFNSNAMVAMGVTRMVIRQYTLNENDSLTEESTEEGLIAAKEFEFGFNGNGDMASFKRVASILGDPVDSTSLSWVYGDDDQPDFVNITSVNGKTAGVYSYSDQEGKRVIDHYQDPEGISVRYLYDASTNRRYETQYDASGGGTVIVYGPEGSLPDGEELLLQEEILERRSEFVDYGVAGSLKEVMLIEVDGRKPLRMIEMAELGSIKGTYTFSYLEEGALHRIDFQSADDEDMKTETRFHYNEFGDLSKITFNEENPNAGNLTTVQKFFYDEDGRLIRRVRTKKVGLGSLNLDRIDLVSY